MRDKPVKPEYVKLVSYIDSKLVVVKRNGRTVRIYPRMYV